LKLKNAIWTQVHVKVSSLFGFVTLLAPYLQRRLQRTSFLIACLERAVFGFVALLLSSGTSRLILASQQENSNCFGGEGKRVGLLLEVLVTLG